MGAAATIANQVAIMFFIVVIGFVCFKIGFITEEGCRQLSNITLRLVNPLLILCTYQMDFNREVFHGILWAFLLATLSHIISIAVTTLLIRRGKDTAVERISSVYSNCGYMGIPLVQAIFGAEGVIYVTAYMTVFNIFFWTHGVMEMRGEHNFKELLRVLRSPVIVATAAGIVMYVTGLRLPAPVFTALDYIGSVNTPLAMLVAGATIAGTKLLSAFKNPGVYKVCLFKLLLVPALTLAAIAWLPLPRMIISTVVIASACPTAVAGTLFAVSYGKNASYSSELFAVTTALSALTLPLAAAMTELVI